MVAKVPSGHSSKRLFVEAITLATARGRLLVVCLLTTTIYFAHYHWLDHLSLFGDLGIHAPSIGLTRAYWLILHGEPTAAWHRNALIYLVLVIGLPLLAKDLARLKAHLGNTEETS